MLNREKMRIYQRERRLRLRRVDEFELRIRRVEERVEVLEGRLKDGDRVAPEGR
jgi:hypothetical protein